MTSEQITTRIADITKERDDFVVEVNKRLMFLNGKIEALSELIEDVVTEGEDTPPLDESRPDTHTPYTDDRPAT